jgi:glyoxylase-like metal-dependent hydrolase (beta-lactamase superfamily II)
VVAPAAGEECLVVDPGIEVLDWLADALRENKLRPAAVLLTHGHFDHVYTVTPVCQAHDVPALIHTDDEYRLADPVATMDPSIVAMFSQEFGRPATWTAPSDVRTVHDEETVEIAGLSLRVVHAPGHTEGSAMFSLPGIPDAIASAPGNAGALPASTVLSGDVLFAGSIGRTDLPGGDMDAMRTSLREKVLTLPDDALVLPGHGPGTTIGRERAVNPYLATDFLAG